MSKKGISKMMLTEAIAVGILGSLSGFISAVIMMNAIPLIVGMMWGDVAVKPATAQIAVLCIGGLIAMIIISALPLRNSGKISIMESMRYE
jgi:ABC-type antimicrobial peptide transport system permease subunit